MSGIDAGGPGEAALALWAGFPLDAAPRPLVLTGLPVRILGGFSSNAAKLAFHNGAIESDVEVPAEVLDALCPNPRRQRAGGDVLRVTGAARTVAGFETDRGPRMLPAWELTLSEATAPVVVLEPEVAAGAWRPRGLRGPGGGSRSSALLGDDGRTIRLRFIGSPKQYAYYPDADVLESPAAAVIQPIRINRSVSGAIAPYAQDREVVATLREPLGDRVLVEPPGWPVPVMATKTGTAPESTG